MIEAALIQQIFKYKEDHGGSLPRRIIMGPKYVAWDNWQPRSADSK